MIIQKKYYGCNKARQNTTKKREEFTVSKIYNKKLRFVKGVGGISVKTYHSVLFTHRTMNGKSTKEVKKQIYI